MSTTDQQRLANWKAKLDELIEGGVESFREGGEDAYLIKIDKLQSLIRELEDKINASSHQILRPIRRGRFG